MRFIVFGLAAMMHVPAVAYATDIGIAPQAAQKSAPALDDTAGYYFLLGRHLEAEGQMEKAIAAHKRAIELAPGSAELRAELAGLYARQDRAIEAIEAAEGALQQDKSNREANRILGSIYAAFAEQKQAIRPGDDPSQYAARAIARLEAARAPGAADLSLELMLGRLYLQTGAFDKAIPPLRRIVEEQPAYVEAGMLLSAALHGAGRIADATQALEDVIAESPRYYRAHVRLAELYDEQRRWKDAAAAYAAAQAVNPRIDLTTRRAGAMINAGQAAEAIVMLQGALEKAGERPDPAMLYLLAHAQRQVNDLDAATATAEKLRTSFPDDVRGLYVTVALLESKGKFDEAAGVLRDLMKRAPDDPSLVYQYAHVLDKAGRTADAERALRDVLSRNPSDANALNSLGYMFAERGERLDEAVSLLQRALKIEPDNPSFLDSLGWAYFKQGKLDLADAPLTKAATGLPDNSVIQDHLGDLRFRQKRYADAVQAWERSLSGDGDSIDRAAIEKKLRDARALVKK